MLFKTVLTHKEATEILVADILKRFDDIDYETVATLTSFTTNEAKEIEFTCIIESDND